MIAGWEEKKKLRKPKGNPCPRTTNLVIKKRFCPSRRGGGD